MLLLAGCSSSDGSSGSQGTNGQDGTPILFSTDTEPAGINCANAGRRIAAGLDTNRNNQLDTSEVTQSRYACNGSNGSDGATASKVLVKTDVEPSGIQCVAGGFSIRVGLDTNANNLLDTGEVTSTDYVCNGLPGANGARGLSSLITTGSEAAGVNCAHGGTRFSTGLDINSNATLEATEVTSSSYACNGSPGSSGSNGTNGSSGSNGLISVMRISNELSGANCSTGGTRVDAGLDTNRSTALDNNEITSTAYVCNAERVRIRNWISSALIESQDLGSAVAPQITLDASGNALAVWQQSDGTRFSIWANRFTPSTGWGSAVLIETDDTGDASSPQIAIDSKGDAIAIWQQADSSGTVSIYANRFSAITDNWANPVLVETGAQDSFNPKVVLDASGNALAVWQQLDGLRTSIWANRFTHTSSTWGVAQQIEENNDGDATSPQIAVNPSGNAIAVWEQRDSTGLPSIWANGFTPSIGWGRAVPIETGIGSAEAPQVAIDASSNVVAVWQQSDGIQMNIWANRFTTSGRWASAVLIGTNDSGNAITPQVAFDGIGNAMAVWNQHNGIGSTIHFNRLSASSNTWGQALPIDINTNLGNASHPQVSFNANGLGFVVWQQSESTNTVVGHSRFVPNSGWGRAFILGGTTNNVTNARAAQIAINASGDAMAVWQQSDGTRFNIMHNHYR
jgi:hypothetical protein